MTGSLLPIDDNLRASGELLSNLETMYIFPEAEQLKDTIIKELDKNTFCKNLSKDRDIRDSIMNAFMQIADFLDKKKITEDFYCYILNTIHFFVPVNIKDEYKRRVQSLFKRVLWSHKKPCY
ncbi:MAG: hypothetical protein SP4CHLAM5_06390 [Chlamydiia bacterium]|nr:hypothetical protein [Chlamydiia bacterium]MCH9618507.1 hypothetical protein [Chlamydiia bacterium]MCH9623796.1 hypothetical protein [Chlamydiia bacterium]